MLPLLPFALGLLAGATAVRALKNASVSSSLDKAKASLGKAQEHLREAAVSSLTIIENTSSRARNRLTSHLEPAAAAESAVPASIPEDTAKTNPTKRRRAATPRKRAPKAGSGSMGQPS